MSAAGARTRPDLQLRSPTPDLDRAHASRAEAEAGRDSRATRAPRGEPSAALLMAEVLERQFFGRRRIRLVGRGRRRRRRARRRDGARAAAAVHPSARHARGSRALPDRVRRASRIDRGADRGTALRRGACLRRSRRAGRRARDASRCTSATARSSRSASTRSKTHVVDPEPYEISPAAAAAINARARRRAAASSRSGRRRRARSRTRRAAARRPQSRRDAARARDLHPSRVRLPGDLGSDDELPPAEVVAADAGRPRSPAASASSTPTARRSRSATGSTATATRCWFV